MANRKLENNVQIDKERFNEVLKYRKKSFRNLEIHKKKIGRSSRMITNYLNNGEMPYSVLDNLAKFLDVEPDYLCGKYHKKVKKVKDKELKKIMMNNLRPENYPYFKKEVKEALSDENYIKFLDDVLFMNNISKKQFEKLSIKEQIEFYEKVFFKISEVIYEYFKVNSFGESTYDHMEYARNMVGDYENRIAELIGFKLQ